MTNAEDATMGRTDAGIERPATVSATENATIQTKRKRSVVGHNGYWLARVLRSGAPNRRSAVGRRWEARRLAYALARGYPAWSACPAPLQAMVDNTIRGEFFAAALFSGFWTGGPDAVPRVYLTASENLRRALADLGEDAAPAQDLAAVLAAMRTSDRPRETSQRGSHAKDGAP